MTPALIDRLSLTAAHIEGMAEGVRRPALPDPVGEVVEDSAVQTACRSAVNGCPWCGRYHL